MINPAGSTRVATSTTGVLAPILRDPTTGIEIPLVDELKNGGELAA